MDRKETPKSDNGNENDMRTHLGHVRRSDVTGKHDAGSGANETIDGFDANMEATRQGAEDIPVGRPERELEDLPVFDRGDALPKV